jgi:CBS domain-containing protein
MNVSDVLSVKGTAIVSIRADQPLTAAIALMAKHKVGSVIVLDLSHRPLGIVSEPDIVATINKLGAECLHQDTRLAMRAPPPKCAPEHSASEALARMTRDRVRYLLVVDGEKLLGLVSIGDLVKARLESTELEARVLRDMARGKLLAGA